MTAILRSALAVLTLTLTATPALAETLTMSSWLPPGHPVLVNAILPWAADVEKATEGRVRIVVPGKPLGTPQAHFDLARDGIADIAYGQHPSSEGDRFAGAMVGQFSRTGDDAVGTSTAFWRVYKERLDAHVEHAGTHLLGLWTHGPGLIHTGKVRIGAPEDFAGLKLRVPAGYVHDLLDALGATPLFMPAPEIYEKLSRGVIDGGAFSYEAVTAFNLIDHVRYTMRVPGGLYNSTWYMVMNEDRWNAISPEDRAVIEALSGEALARRVGEAWNAADAASIERMTGAGIEIHDAAEPIVAQVDEIAARLESEWIARIGAERDGAAALADYRAQTAAGR